MKPFLVAGTLVLAVFLTQSAAADGLTKIVVHGVPMEIYGNVDLQSSHPNFNQSPIVTAGNQVVIRDDSDIILSFVGIFEGDGRTYVLVEENNGGNSCSGHYQAIDMSSAKPIVSHRFGTCGGAPRPSVREGALQVTMPSTDGKSVVTFTFHDGNLSRTSRPIGLSGPALAPGGDLAAFVHGKSIDEIFRLRAAVTALETAMGPSAFAEAKSMALTGASSGDAEAKGEYVLVSACQAHSCNTHSVQVAFDHLGHAWASILRNGKLTYYGNPDGWVQEMLLQPNSAAGN